ncbi:MAG: hypothetical protein QNK83_00640 [Akkermansiaceae bacterium]
MRHIAFPALPILVILLAAPFLSAQDQVVLKNGDNFSGTVVGLSEGFVKLQSPLSDTPLEIKSEQLKGLSFKEVSPGDLPPHAHQLNLRNGDVIPGHVTGLDGTTLQFKTWFAGPLSVPRSQIRSLFYGVAPQRLLYQGPTSQEEWDSSEDWEFKNGALTSTTKDDISRDLELPDSFIFRFNLKWENSPNVRIYFCTDADTSEDNENGYYLNFSSRGGELFRVLPSEDEDKPQHQLNLGSSNKRSSDFTSRQCTIELRVDRASRRIHFYLDDQLQGSFLDPHPAPEGSKVIFYSASSVRRQITISAIKLREWDAVTQRLRFEPRQDEDNDTLTTDDADRYSGQIIKRIATGDTTALEVKSPLLPQAIQIPEARTSILYFKKGDLPAESHATFKLDLASGGNLKLSDIQLSKDQLSGTHPWLGKITLDRRVVSEISLNKKAAEKESSEKTTQAEPRLKEPTARVRFEKN